MNLRPIFYVNGMFLMILSISMILPMLGDLYFGYDDWLVFFTCIIITAFFGGCLLLANTGTPSRISLRQAFLLTNTTWVTLSIFGALPFWFSSLNMSFTDALFESISGITTTGATVIIGLDYAPAGILLWRAMLQWLGGIGIIIMALSVLPFLKVGGMQIFRTDMSRNEKAMPRAAEQTKMIAIVYGLLTLLCTISYMIAGMEVFDALAHAMSTISTGGYSTFDTSFAHYDNFGPEFVAIIFMILGALPFILYLRVIRGDLHPLITNSQVRVFLIIIAITTLLTALYLFFELKFSPWESIRQSSFNVVSVMTGTGFMNGDYATWGGFCASTFFFLMVIGGCAGSTTCGIKIFRFQVLYAVIVVQIRKLVHPHGVFIPHYNGRPMPEDVPLSVMAFFFIYALCFALLAICLSFTGLDFLTAMSGAVASISNVGPGLGNIIGPTGTFQSLADGAKWLLCFGMLLGRLELFTVLVMFSPYFWKY